MTAVSRPISPAWALPDVERAPEPVPFVDTVTMIEADRVATDILGLGLLQLLENAGRELADLTRRTFSGSVRGRRVLVLAGTGNNAGGGLVAARRLAGWGADVGVILARPGLRLRPGPRAQIEPLLAAGVRIAVAGHDRSRADVANDILQADAVIDALIGYSLRGAPDEPYRALIALASLGGAPVISLDVPSGIDATTGERPGAAIVADMTLAIALPKRGTRRGEGRRCAGVQYLADIGIPRSVFTDLGVGGAWGFPEGPLVRLD